MTIAVTAASGKLGSEIVRVLARLGTHSVVGLARTPAKVAHPGVEIRFGTAAWIGWLFATASTSNKHNGQTYNLHGEALSQAQLASYLHLAFDTNLIYREMTVEEYRREPVAELGDFIGGVIAGIYASIGEGAMDNPTQFSQAAGREHQPWADCFANLRSI